MHPGQRRSTKRSSQLGHSYTTLATPTTTMGPPCSATSPVAHTRPVTQERRCAPSSHQKSPFVIAPGAALVETRRLTGLMVAFCEVQGVASCGGIQPDREVEIAVPLVEMRGDRVAPRDVFVDVVQGRQSCGCAVRFATATARLSRTIGVSANRSSSSYHSTICTQSVSSKRAASAWSAAIAACAWYSPS